MSGIKGWSARHSPFYFLQSPWILQQKKKTVRGNIPTTHFERFRRYLVFFILAIRSPVEILDWILAARMAHSYPPLQTICLRTQNWGTRAAAARFQCRRRGCMQVCQNRSIADMQSSFRDEVLQWKCGYCADAAASAGGSANIWLSPRSKPSKRRTTWPSSCAYVCVCWRAILLLKHQWLEAKKEGCKDKKQEQCIFPALIFVSVLNRRKEYNVDSTPLTDVRHSPEV